MNILYILSSYFANKYKRIFIISYTALAAFVFGLLSLATHASHYAATPACIAPAESITTTSTATSLLTSINCFIATNIAGQFPEELHLLHLIATTIVLPHASHIMMWMAFWSVLDRLWPLMRGVCSLVWRERWQIGWAFLWIVVFLGARSAKIFSAAFGEMLHERAAMNATTVGEIGNGVAGNATVVAAAGDFA